MRWYAQSRARSSRGRADHRPSRRGRRRDEPSTSRGMDETSSSYEQRANRTSSANTRAINQLLAEDEDRLLANAISRIYTSSPNRTSRRTPTSSSYTTNSARPTSSRTPTSSSHINSAHENRILQEAIGRIRRQDFIDYRRPGGPGGRRYESPFNPSNRRSNATSSSDNRMLQNAIDQSFNTGYYTKPIEKLSVPKRNSSVLALIQNTSNSNSICVICTVNPKQLAFFPCGHFCICEVCAHLLVDKKCPICRVNTNELRWVYIRALTCAVCSKRPSTAAVFPCGDFCVCKTCAPSVTVCPICKRKISEIKPVYI